jgi:hypothetical protein
MPVPSGGSKGDSQLSSGPEVRTVGRLKGTACGGCGALRTKRYSVVKEREATPPVPVPSVEQGALPPAQTIAAPQLQRRTALAGPIVSSGRRAATARAVPRCRRPALCSPNRPGGRPTCVHHISRKSARRRATVCVFAIGTELTGIPLHRVVSEAAPTSHRLKCPTTTGTHSRRSQKLPDP